MLKSENNSGNGVSALGNPSSLQFTRREWAQVDSCLQLVDGPVFVSPWIAFASFFATTRYQSAEERRTCAQRTRASEMRSRSSQQEVYLSEVFKRTVATLLYVNTYTA